MATIGIIANRHELNTPECAVISKEILKQGHYACLLDFDLFEYTIGQKETFYNRRPLPQLERLITRVGSTATEFDIATLRHLEAQGIKTYNRSTSIYAASNKLLAYQVLAQNGFPIPKTKVLHWPFNPDAYTDALGFPLIVKVTNGSFGNGVYKLTRLDEFNAFVQFIDRLGYRGALLIQETMLVGSDVRVIVVGDHICTPIRRFGPLNDFRSNLSRPVRQNRFDYKMVNFPDSTWEEYVLSDEQKAIILRAMKVFGLHIAGFDLLLDNYHRLYINEINPNPGFDGFEKATGDDLQKCIDILINR